MIITFEHSVCLYLVFRPTREVAIRGAIPITLGFYTRKVFHFLPTSFYIHKGDHFQARGFLFRLFYAFASRRNHSFLGSTLLYLLLCRVF